jgi:hypothetical protein
MSAQQAADAAGVSKARWSQVENGYEKKPDGMYYPVRASDGLLARMADAVGLGASRLESEGDRPDAAAVLREMERRSAGDEGHGVIPGDAPVCTFEDSILGEPNISDDMKADVIRIHRLGQHANCRPLAEDAPERERALA